MINKALLVGNLGADPETRYTNEGKPVTQFKVATSEKYKGEEKTEWHNVVCFGKTAEFVGQYLKKGNKVFVEGKIQTDKFEKDGQTKYFTKIIGFNVQNLSPRNSGNTPEGIVAVRDQMGGMPDDDLDIPFAPAERGWLV